MRAQAVPIATYRRTVAVAYMRRQLAVLAAVGLCLCTLSPSLVTWEAAPTRVAPSTARSLPVSAPSLLVGPLLETTHAPAAAPALLLAEAEPDAEDAAPAPIVVADARASTSHLDEAGIYNVLIALSFVDGVVMPPGARLVFDDVARTWDYREDPSYVMGRATSIRGLINMRGGGVCTVSTALWRAALAAGLRTDRRQSHYGLMEPGGPGLDATNTLIIANDSNEAVRVHVWLDGDSVRAQLIADGDLGRIVNVAEPRSLGNRRWLLEQEVTWADGRTTVDRFVSQYYW